MQANKRQNARALNAVATLRATLLIALLGACWEWRRALTADPFHYSDAVSVVSALLIALTLFVLPALVIWLVARSLRRQLLAPALVAASFLFLDYLARFSSRGISVRTATFVAGIVVASALAVLLAALVRRWTERPPFHVLLLLGSLTVAGVTAFEFGLLRSAGSDDSGRSVTGVAPASPGAPNLVLITIDTFRTDFLGAYGNAHVYTPHMDRFARDGTQVIRALSSIPITLPSHATLMTGTHPATHGIYNNGFAFSQPENSVLAGHLRGFGYRTAAFVAAFPLHASFGLSAGFDVYNDDTEQATFLSIYQVQKFLNGSSTGAILKRLGRAVISHRVAERRGEGVWGAAREWLDRQGDAPFFLWLHFYDPHAPYDPGSTFTKLYHDRTVLRGGYDLADIRVPEYARLNGVTDIQTYRRLYAGEVTRIDRVIGEVSAYFDERDWTENTLFALTSDHGEGLASHDVLVHTQRIYDEQTSVPLFLRGPGVEAGLLSNTPIRLVDLAPTLLGIASLPALAEADGRFVDAAGAAADRNRANDNEFLHVAETPVDGGRRSIESSEWKLIHALGTDSYELFHHAEDPGESRDRIADRAADEPFRTLRDLLASIPTGLGGENEADLADLPEAARQKLRGLGYLNDD